MKRFKKLAAVLSSAIIAVSAFSIPVPVSALYNNITNQTYEYLSDESNVTWKTEYIRVYKNGTAASEFRDFSSVFFKPADGAEITAETLGLPEGYEVKEADSFVSDSLILASDAKEWLMIPTGSREKTEEIAVLAENWIKSGIVLEAKKYKSCIAGCVYTLNISAEIKNTDDAESFLSDYETMNFSKSSIDNVYNSKVLSQEEVAILGEIYNELEADERVERISVNWSCCEVIHQSLSIEDIGSVVPTDYSSAAEFVENHAETVVNGNEAVIVVPGFDDENYGYVFADGGEGKAYTVKSKERFVEELNPDMTYSDSYVKKCYDVYVLELNSDSDIDIGLNFVNLNKTEDYITKTKLCYTLQESGEFKVSDRPTTRKQVIKFISENGNIKVNNDNAVVVMESAGIVGPHECTSPYNTAKPVLTTKYEIGTDETVYSCSRNSNGEIEFDFPGGGSIYTVYQYSLDSNAKYGLKFISAQQNNETAETPFGYVTSYNYTIEKNENGAKLVSESAEKYESTPYGDVNFDSVINIYDAIAVSRYLMNPDTLNETELYAADFNRDGQKDLYDVINIAKTLM